MTKSRDEPSLRGMLEGQGRSAIDNAKPLRSRQVDLRSRLPTLRSGTFERSVTGTSSQDLFVTSRGKAKGGVPISGWQIFSEAGTRLPGANDPHPGHPISPVRAPLWGTLPTVPEQGKKETGGTPVRLFSRAVLSKWHRKRLLSVAIRGRSLPGILLQAPPPPIRESRTFLQVEILTRRLRERSRLR